MDAKMVTLVSTAVYVLTLVMCVQEQLRRKSRENGVYLPGIYFWIGAVCGAVFVAFGWLGAEEGMFPAVVFGSGSVLGSVLMLGWRNCYIVYDREGFTQKNLIGMYRRFGYADVTRWYSHPRYPTESTICALGKKISFNLLSPNSAGFLTALGAGYRRTHGGENMPTDWRPEGRGGFRTHVRNAEEFLAVFILLVVFIAGMGGWCVWMSWTPLDGSDCEQLSVTFTDQTVEDEYLILKAKGYTEEFEIRGFPEYVSRPEALQARCDGKTVFTVLARRINGDNDPDYYWLQSIEADGIEYLTLEDATAQRRSELPMLMMFFGGFLVLWLAFAGLMFLVGSDPEKYPKWLVKGLFKEGYIDY